MTTIPLIALLLVAPQIPERGGVRGQTTLPRTEIKVKPNIQLEAPPKPVELKFRTFTMTYKKAEDEDGKDEPYLFTAGFRLHIAHDLRGFFLAGNSEQVFPITPLGHHNIVSTSNGWARSGKRYAIAGQEFTSTVPGEGGLQVVGYMTMFMEQDGWNAEQIRRFAADFPNRFKNHLAALQKETVRQPQRYIDDTIRQIGRWVYDFQAARWITFMSTYGSGDSDDTGGTQVALVVNFGPSPIPKVTRRGVQLVTGGWYPADRQTYTELRPRAGVQYTNVRFDYPAGNVNFAPPKARWQGQAILGAIVTRNN